MAIDLRTLRQYQDVFNRAPSAHNTQPWLLEYFQDHLELKYDPTRSLPVSDPTQRDLWLGLGAFVETVIIVAQEKGIFLRFAAEVDPTSQLVGTFSETKISPGSIFTTPDIEKRQTSRLKYQETQPLRPAQFKELSALLPSWLKLHHLSTEDVKLALEAGDTQLLADRDYVQELRQWLRLSSSHPKFNQDGLNKDVLDLNFGQAQFLSLALSPIMNQLRKLGLAKLLAKEGSVVLSPYQSVLVLVSHQTDPADLLVAGQYLMKLWLRAAQLNCFTHPLSQVLDSPIAKSILVEKLPENSGQPISIFRIGTSHLPARSPRLS
jgi:hypothetical protein